MIKTVLFDMDGTLDDSFEGITNSVVYALKKSGIAPPDDKRKLTPFIGPPLYESFMNMFGLDEQAAWRAVEFYREYYERYGIFDAVVYPGVEDMLRRLDAAKLTLAVATSKPEIAAKRIVSQFGLERFFGGGVFGASLDKSRAHKDEVIAYALDAVGADKSATVMVGDKNYDILGAKHNGIKSIGILYGYGKREELEAAGADAILPDPASVADAILNSL